MATAAHTIACAICLGACMLKGLASLVVVSILKHMSVYTPAATAVAQLVCPSLLLATRKRYVLALFWTFMIWSLCGSKRVIPALTGVSDPFKTIIAAPKVFATAALVTRNGVKLF